MSTKSHLKFQRISRLRFAGFATLLLMLSVLSACNSLPKPSSGDMATASDDTPQRRRARIKMELAAAYYSKGELSTALDDVKDAINLDPSLPDVENLRGLIYAAIGDDDRAEESFRAALSADPRNAGAMHNYAWFDCQRGLYAKADLMFAQALAVPKYRDAARTLMAKGVCLARASKLPEAEATLMQGYQMAPNNPAIGTNLASVLYHQGKYERARFYIHRVNDNADQSNAETLWLGARIERKLHDIQAFNDLVNQLRSRYPASPEVSSLDQGRFDD